MTKKNPNPPTSNVSKPAKTDKNSMPTTNSYPRTGTTNANNENRVNTVNRNVSFMDLIIYKDNK
ncbi:hypothetical protein I6E61_09145 [Psychrobacter sp. NZS113]|uniref:hypothetical protein n=1 Tax=Psychrobacter sp. NZS113 TaxID=2792045 RepID=UPI0018CF66CF|nr:hypothetical protein [Psychrobacter sp. NZS113]MBH0096547.1 hypothetical protein [Psychrobacter sp. NZS113]